MKLTIDEIYNAAIMSSTPTIIVEGVDDMKTYLSIAKSSIRKFEIYAIENIKDYAAGCDNIVLAINSLRSLNSPTPPEDHIVGIIDKDVRDFRDEVPTDPAILTLKYYSLESHFVSKDVLRDALGRYTKTHSSLLSTNLLDHLFSTIEGGLHDVYYFCLESLKLSKNPGYTAAFTYSCKYGRMKDPTTNAAVLGKVASLDHFAAEIGASKSMGQLLLFCKGKWLLERFCDETLAVLKSFSNYCGTHDAQQCNFCANGATEKCLYKLKEGITNRTIYSGSTENTDVPSLDYIRDRLRQLRLAVPA